MGRGSKRSAESKPDTPAQQAAALPVRAKDDEPLDKLPAAKGNLTVFGDDSDGDVDVPAQVTSNVTQSQAEPEVDESEEESDDDEAPEAVSTQAAASLAKQSTQAAQKKAQQ